MSAHHNWFFWGLALVATFAACLANLLNAGNSELDAGLNPFGRLVFTMANRRTWELGDWGYAWQRASVNYDIVFGNANLVGLPARRASRRV